MFLFVPLKPLCILAFIVESNSEVTDTMYLLVVFDQSLIGPLQLLISKAVLADQSIRLLNLQLNIVAIVVYFLLNTMGQPTVLCLVDGQSNQQGFKLFINN